MARLEFLGLELHVAGCPNACRHCKDNGRPPFGALMSVEDARWVLEQFRPRTKTLCAFPFFEPTAHPDLPALCTLCQKFNNDPEAADWSTLATNGYGIARAEDPGALLRELRQVGVRMLSFTLHGEREHHDWFVCRRGASDDIWTAARHALAAGMGAWFNFYPDRHNAADLAPVLERVAKLGDTTGGHVQTVICRQPGYVANPRMRVYERELRPRVCDLESIRRQVSECWGKSPEDYAEGTWVRRLLDAADPLPRPRPSSRDRAEAALVVDGAFNVYEKPWLSEYLPVRHGNLKTGGMKDIMKRYMAWQPPEYPEATELAALCGDRDSDLLHPGAANLYVKWIDRWLREHGAQG